MDETGRGSPLFTLLTNEVLAELERRDVERREKESKTSEGEEKEERRHDDDEDIPDKTLEAAKKLPPKYFDAFPAKLAGKPLMDIDPYYADKNTFIVINKDKALFRFSRSRSFFLLTPTNIIRRCALLALTHPLFSLFVMFTILINCVFMTMQTPTDDADAPPAPVGNDTGPSTEQVAETVFTVIYTTESVIKILARGIILNDFTYLRDAWNWLDFAVILLAYLMFFIPALANLSALRTFRVLRALKTVAVVPGLKTIVGALMEAVRRLRDVGILSSFVLSIFALIGLQIYSGSLTRKCILTPPPFNDTMFENMTLEEYGVWEQDWLDDEENFHDRKNFVCGLSTDAGQCPEGYSCYEGHGENPNYGYTSYDNFGWALLCSFRLMTQDYWENLYQLIIRANGPWHISFFIPVIFLGAFYLVNLILAIVAMSYDEQQKADKADQEEQELLRREEEERKKVEEAEHHPIHKSPSESSCGSLDIYIQNRDGKDGDGERRSIKSDCCPSAETKRRLSVLNGKVKKTSLSLPGSPFAPRRGSRGSQFSWKKPRHIKGHPMDRQPLVLPYLESINLPYADDSNAVTPSSEELCTMQRTHPNFLAARRASMTSKRSNGFPLDPPLLMPRGSRCGSFSSRVSRQSYSSPAEPPSKTKELAARNTRNREHRATHPLLPEVIVDKTKSSEDDNVSPVAESSSSGSECDAVKQKLFVDNPFICRTPSQTVVDMKDVMVLNDLIDQTSGKRRSKSHDFGLGMFSEEGVDRKALLKAAAYKFFCVWNCPGWLLRIQKLVALIILDAFSDLFITLCIAVNTLFMALDQYPMDPDLAHTLANGNTFFTTIFALEFFLKLIALNPKNYFKDPWNVFDSIIVFLSLLEVGLANVQGLSVLRTFRLLRVFKLAKSWPTLNLLMGIIVRTIGALGNLTFVLAIIIFIFAVVGMQLFGQSYYQNKHLFEGGEVPRWSFVSFLHSFMIVFRVLCGEWIESMWDCILVYNYLCVPFFLLTMIIGNLVVLNLFLALLLSSFGAESLQASQGDSEPNKMQEATDRINRFIIWIRVKSMQCLKKLITRKNRDAPAVDCDHVTKADGDVIMDGDIPVIRNGRIVDNHDCSVDDDRSISSCGSDQKFDVNCEECTCSQRSEAPTRPASMDSGMGRMRKSASRDSKVTTPGGMSRASTANDDMSDLDDGKTQSEPEPNEVDVVFVKYPDDCCPNIIHKRLTFLNAFLATGCGKLWWKTRCYMYKLVEHKYFEYFIMFMIAISSISLAIEDIYLDLPERWLLKAILNYMDKAYTVIFVFEMFVKWFAFGYKKYFTDAWCWLDFIIVVISLITLGGELIGTDGANMGSFRAMRTLRALRPLRAVSRWEGMRVVVNALIQAVPSICNVLLVCLVFWLIFSIMGVQLFAGTFFKCVDADGNQLNTSIIVHRNDCDANAHLGYEWVNSKINFDNVLNAYLALFQVATFKGWMQIMIDSTDAVGEDKQPEREVSLHMYLYYVLFIIFGAFFTLNLFIGVIIDNFNMQKKKAGGSLEMFMTDDQKKYYNAMKKLGSKQPQKPIPRPRFKWQQFFFDATTNQKFDIFIMICILLNMAVMAADHYGKTRSFEVVLEGINTVFVAIFGAECVMKLIGLRWYYFKQPWNVFDFVIVVISFLAMGMKNVFENLPISPTLIRVIRVFRVGRVLRLVKSAKGIRTLLFSLAVSLPALFNIGLLLFLVMFIYAIFGVSFFSRVKHTHGIDDMFNFETFGRSMIILFQISTSAGWHDVLAALMNDKRPDCDPDFVYPYTTSVKGNCGSTMLGMLYLVTYLIISFLVIINMYIAVILENFSQATEDVQQGLTQDDFDTYYEKWEKYDPDACQYIRLDQLSDFVDDLEEPLRLPKPNLFKLTSLDIAICANDRLHCVDILDALTKNFLGTTTEGDISEVKPTVPDRPNYEPISSTLRRQREIYCARMIQALWRKYAREKAEGRRRRSTARPVDASIEELDETKKSDSDAESAPNVQMADDGTKTVELHPESGVVA